MTEQEFNAVTQELANLRTVVSDALANRCIEHTLVRLELQRQIEELKKPKPKK